MVQTDKWRQADVEERLEYALIKVSCEQLQSLETALTLLEMKAWMNWTSDLLIFV